MGCQLGTHKIARETECNPYTRPESERACQAPPCPLYAWRADEWQEVSRARKWAPASVRSTPLPSSHPFPREALQHGDKAGSFPKGLLSDGQQFTPTIVGELLLFLPFRRLCSRVFQIWLPPEKVEQALGQMHKDNFP